MSLKAVVDFFSAEQDLDKELIKFVDKAVQRSTYKAQRNVQSETPVKHGTLKRSIQSRFPEFGKGEIFSSSNFAVDVSYAVFVEYGTRFMPPRAMFRKGIEKSREEIKTIFAEEAKNVTIRLTKIS